MKLQRPKKRPYTGTLSKPSMPIWELKEPRNQELYAEHQSRGLELLFKHFKIEVDASALADGTAFMDLALHLAWVHVPYFYPRDAKHGRKAAAETGHAMLLEIDVALRRLAGDRTAAQAIRHLVKNQRPWNLRGRARDATAAEDLSRRRRDWKKQPKMAEVRQAVEYARSVGGRAALEEYRRNLLRENSALR